jgi:phospholipid-binding lipoprotein MlaA
MITLSWLAGPSVFDPRNPGHLTWVAILVIFACWGGVSSAAGAAPGQSATPAHSLVSAQNVAPERDAISAKNVTTDEDAAATGDEDASAPGGEDAAPTGAVSNDQPIQDPLIPVNKRSFNVNQNLDQRAFHPLANLWSKAVPEPARECVGRFFDNAGVMPRFANALFQLRLRWAATELARFGINSTVGMAGLFDPADKWLGLKEHDNNFGLTLARYGVGRGFYIVPPAGRPFDARDVVGGLVDSLMNPLNYVVPGSATLYKAAAHGIEGLNSRAQKQQMLDDVDRFAIDKYGAVQDAYVQKQMQQEQAVKRGE